MAGRSGRLSPVAWTEGMFLRPQHFQHHDLYLEERLRHHIQTLDPFHWGVHELVVNEEALSDHRFEVLRLEAVLPGGAVVRYPGNCTIETREFDPSIERLDVHLGLRLMSNADANAGSDGDGNREVRYRVRQENLPDLNRGGFEAPVEVQQQNLRLFFGGEEENLEVHDSIKLARLVATGEIKAPFALAPRYCPPLLAVQSSQALTEEVAQIVAQIAAKVRVVAGRTSTISIADLPRMWMRYTLARMTPVLRHLLSTGETRPFDLYTALVETAGSLAAFNMMEPAELPEYKHDDLFGCFGELIEFLDGQLTEAVPDRFKEVTLEYDSAQHFYVTTELNTDDVDPRNLFFLGVKADLEAAELAKRVVDEGKAGSVGNVKIAMRMNIAGLPIEHLAAAPTEIAARAGYQYFTLDPHGPKWSKVREDFSLALSIPKVESADVRLYVVSAGDAS
ncbi:MAG: type VI secretion system baseplate subunit TssK [Myxococcota bacterium]